MTNLDSILKSRDITLSTKVRIVKAMVFPAVIYGCESRTIKKAKCQRIDAFELWCWRRLLTVPWTARRFNKSILGDQSWVFIGNTDAEAETPILCPSDAKSWLTGKDPDVGKDWGQEEKGTIEDEMAGWHHQLNEHGFRSWHATVHGVAKSQTRLSDWTERHHLTLPSSFSSVWVNLCPFPEPILHPWFFLFFWNLTTTFFFLFHHCLAFFFY